jgi:N-acetyl-1-D-myo-inositol-2-amino-2-deoxy-alpha-D-glucopyranoside deacetylase
MSHRLLFVHAHPDDETVGTGATMARYAAEGHSVTLVTCTQGEEGEVLVGDLGHLAAAESDALGPHRQGELESALAELGVTDHHWLGGPGRYRDSGMMGTPPNDRRDCFWRADLLEAATDLVSVIRDRRPEVLVTYDDFGGYGHPDHIQAHRVAMYATLLAAAPGFRGDLGEPWQIRKIYWTALPREYIRQGIRALAERGGSGFFGITDPDQMPEEMPGIVDDALVTTVVDATGFADAKVAALRAHATQVAADGPFFEIAEAVGAAAFGVEHYRLVAGELGPVGADGREAGLLAGL